MAMASEDNPPQEHTLILRGKRYSAVGILSTEGVEDVYITDGTVDGDEILEFVRQNLLPLLKQNSQVKF